MTNEHNKQIPFSISEWEKVGRERGYWDYFKKKVLDEKIYNQCKNKLVIDKKKPIIYYCAGEKGHKGLHEGYVGYRKIKKIIYWTDC